MMEVITAISKAGHKKSNHEVTEHDYNQNGLEKTLSVEESLSSSKLNILI